MKRLKRYLEETETSQKELATMCRVSQATVSDWLGSKFLPSAEKLVALSNATGLSIDELLDHEPTRHSEGVARPSA